MKTSECLTLAVTLLFAVSCSHGRQQGGEDLPEISVAEAVTDSVVIYHTYPGELKANNTVDLVGRVNGYLRAKHYDDGQLVEKGRLLFTIEDTQYRDQVRQAQSDLATARSNRDYAAAQYAAMTKALESDAVSVMEVNKAKSSLEQAEASIRSAEAQLQTAQTNLGYCRIYAPYRGHVSVPTMSVGSYVSGEGAPVTLATLYEDATLYAEFHIADKAMQEILLGDRLSKVDLDSIPLEFQKDIPGHYYGRLIYVSPEVNRATGTLTLRAEVDNTGGYLHDGMYVSIRLPSLSDPSAILVKDAAIGTDQLGKYLFTVNDSSKVVYTPIRTGDMVMDSMCIVDSGIAPGTRYVTKALLKVRDGMTVKPVFEK